MAKKLFPLELLLDNYANLKNPTFDILPDFVFILEYQLWRFKDVLSDYVLAGLNEKLKTAKRCKSKPQSKNRLYLITDIDIPELILFDVEKCILNNFMYSCDIIGHPDPLGTPPDFCNTLFIFSSEMEQPYVMDICTKTFAEILRCFHSQNALCNRNVRDSWCNEPKRHSRSHI